MPPKLIAVVVLQIVAELSLVSAQDWTSNTTWSKSYLLPLNKTVNFVRAKLECDTNDGRMFRPRNWSEVEFVMDTFRDQIGYSMLWIGAWNYPHQFTYTWVDTTRPVDLSLFENREQ